jgi:hypothetical protein
MLIETNSMVMGLVDQSSLRTISQRNRNVLVEELNHIDKLTLSQEGKAFYILVSRYALRQIPLYLPKWLISRIPPVFMLKISSSLKFFFLE